MLVIRFVTTTQDFMFPVLPIANGQQGPRWADCTKSLKCYTPLNMTVLYQCVLQKNLSEQGHWLFQYFNFYNPPTHALEDSSILLLLLKHPPRFIISDSEFKTPAHSLSTPQIHLHKDSEMCQAEWLCLSLKSSSAGIHLEILTLGDSGTLYLNLEHM